MPPKERSAGKTRNAQKPRGKNCRWTKPLDRLLKNAWATGGPRAARHAIMGEQPTWGWHSIKRRSGMLGIRRPRPAPWTKASEDDLLWSIGSNASLSLIAKRLGRSVAAIRGRLWVLGYKAESLGGYKVKDLAEMLGLPPGRIQYWVAARLLLTKGGRITERSFSKFLKDFPEKIPSLMLSPEMRSWLHEMGHPDTGSYSPKEQIFLGVAETRLTPSGQSNQENRCNSSSVTV